ncbi:MAG: hypothetical protein WA970_09110, partial [Gammaproteobacteria bacterium]
MDKKGRSGDHGPNRDLANLEWLFRQAMTVKCITFDLDDTLWDCESVLMRAETVLYQWLAEH